MGTQIDITIDAQNLALTDVLAQTKMTNVDLSTGIVDGLDVTITANVISAPAAGTIRRVIRYTFGPTFLATYITNADQESPFRGLCKSRVEKELPSASVTEGRVVS